MEPLQRIRAGRVDEGEGSSRGDGDHAGCPGACSPPSALARHAGAMRAGAVHELVLAPSHALHELDQLLAHHVGAQSMRHDEHRVVRGVGCRRLPGGVVVWALQVCMHACRRACARACTHVVYTATRCANCACTRQKHPPACPAHQAPASPPGRRGSGPPPAAPTWTRTCTRPASAPSARRPAAARLGTRPSPGRRGGGASVVVVGVMGG